MLSASIEKVSKEQPVGPEVITEMESIAFEAQAKLTQSVSSIGSTQSESKMNDTNLSYQTSDPDTANGNTLSTSGCGKSVIHVSSLCEDVKLKESGKPRKDPPPDDDQKDVELHKKFRAILSKLTPQTFDTLLDEVKTLEINNQKRLEGVIDLIFEKAIDKQEYSQTYAAMCNKLSMLKVPVENAANPEQRVNFRALIINKCQHEFEAIGTDELVLKLENDCNECTDPGKKRELHAMLQGEKRRVRLRSVGNVRFIGELYKLKMLTCKVMDYCMKYLTKKFDEEKLECLCTLLTTVGEQMKNEERSQLDNTFKKMQEIVDRKSDKISTRIKFMIQDVIALRKNKWVGKRWVVDSQPEMMDQIQKETGKLQRKRAEFLKDRNIPNIVDLRGIKLAPFSSIWGSK